MPEAASSVAAHRANDARDGLSSYSNRRDQSGFNGCCTAMWKANGKTTTLSFFLGSPFPKTEIYCIYLLYIILDIYMKSLGIYIYIYVCVYICIRILFL